LNLRLFIKKKMRGICEFMSDFPFSLLYGLFLLFFCCFGHYFGLKLLLSRFLFKFIVCQKTAARAFGIASA